jgi:DNA repair protein RecO (recombination protein O)
MVVRTEAIVLKSMPFRETSRLVTLYTLELGKLTTIARGAQSKKNLFGSTLQVLSYVQAVIYTRPTRSIQLLTNCSHIKVQPGISRDLKRLAIGQRICELVLALTEEGVDSPELFHLFTRTLGALGDPATDAVLVQLYFQLHLTAALGFGPSFTRDEVERIDDSGGYLMLDSGTILRELDTSSRSLAASRGVLRAFAILYRADFNVILRMQLTEEQRRGLYTLITRFMQYHVQDAYPVRGEKVLSQILGLAPEAQ